jgi:hypothetical protein
VPVCPLSALCVSSVRTTLNQSSHPDACVWFVPVFYLPDFVCLSVCWFLFPIRIRMAKNNHILMAKMLYVCPCLPAERLYTRAGGGGAPREPVGLRLSCGPFPGVLPGCCAAQHSTVVGFQASRQRGTMPGCLQQRRECAEGHCGCVPQHACGVCLWMSRCRCRSCVSGTGLQQLRETAAWLLAGC